MVKTEINQRPIVGSSLTYKAFAFIPNDLLITEDTPSGTDIYVAEFPKSLVFKLRKYHKPATQSFPSGGLTLWNPKLKVIYNCYLDGAMIHPNNKKRKRKSKFTETNKFFE